MENLSGHSIKGYELQERIGTGGFGAVYRAYQSTIGREVAVKIILPGFASHPDFIRRFESEAQIIARLEHPYITPLFDYWRDPDGAYLVMRWLRGGSLRDALNKQAFDTEAAALILDQLASALAVAHRNNVIHRDLKPGNILLDEDGNAYLADFGIAKDIGIAGNTEIDVIVGSPDYLSPEQARSEPVTPQTDIYSLGVVLYEMLAGEHPFPMLSPVTLLYKHLSEPLPILTNLPDNTCNNINAVIQKATAKNPAHRYPDALSMAAAFRSAIQSQQPQNLVEILTPREQEILQRVIAGQSNRQIAADLVVTVGTVKWYITQIYRKLNVRSRVQAIVRARELNLIVSGSTTDSGLSVSDRKAIPTDEFKPENPYKGLRAFQAADYRNFFGREKLIDKLLKRLAESGEMVRFLAVIGPSGSGKSSLVKAGLIPALWRGELKDSEKWFIAEMLPGGHPLDELEIALTRVAANPVANLREHLGRDERGLLRAAQLILPDDGSEIVLIIDQFEEVFTLVTDETVRVQFLKLLHTAVTEPRSRIRIVLTLRADFYDRPLQYPDFGELIRNRMETILPLSADGLERAIARPAEQVGVTFEAGLVASIVAEVNYQTGALPLLQYALTELFERRAGRVLTHAAYQEIGGAGGALAHRAEEIFLEFDDDGKAAIRQMFLRLVTLGEGVSDTRRRVQRSELLNVASEAEVMDEVIDTFAAYRLLSLDNDPGTRSPTVEVAHEAILQEWERLKQWINESREDIYMQQQLTYMAAEWYEAHQDSSYLVSGLRLQQMEAWAGEADVVLTPIEQAFLQASITERDERKAAEQARKAYEAGLERRAVQQLRLLVATFAIAAFVGGILSVVAFTQRNAANNARATSDSNALIAQQRADELYSLSLVSAAQDAIDGGDTGLALSLAMESVTGDTPSTESQRILSTLAQQPGPVRVIYEGAATIWTPSWDYHYVAIGTVEGHIVLVELATGAVVNYFQGHRAAITKIQFSMDNTQLIAQTAGAGYLVWDVASTERMTTTRTLDAALTYSEGIFALLPDNRAFLLSRPNPNATIFSLRDAATGEELQEYRFDGERINANAISVHPDGHLAAIGGTVQNSNEGAVLLWNIETDTTIFRLDSLDLNSAVLNLGFLSNSAMLWASSVDETVVIDTTTGNVLQRLRGQVRQQFVLETNRIITDYNGGTLWNLETSDALLQLPRVNTSHLLPDGHTTLVSIGNRLELWDMYIPNWELYSQTEHRDFVTSVAYSPDGHTALSGGGVFCQRGGDNRLIVRDTLTGAALKELHGHETAISAIAYSPDGHYALSGSTDGVTILWDTTAWTEIRRFVRTAAVTSIVFSSDSRTVRVGYAALCWGGIQEVVVWNIADGSIPQRIMGSVVSPNGRLAAFLTQSNITIVDVEADIEQVRLVNDTPLSVPYFSADSQTIFAGDTKGMVYQWDVTTGELIRTLDTGATVTNLWISPNNQYLVAVHVNQGQASCEADKDVELALWDLAMAQSIRRWNMPVCGINWLEFSSDGQMLMVGSYRSLHTYSLSDNQFSVDWIRANRYIREFTCEERQQYRIEPLCEIEETQASTQP